jgi:DNA repair exonuclease SbcCD ATPase subunit
VFGSLDDERRGHVLAALQGLRGLYSQVLLVTHQDALRDALDAVLLVEEQDGRAVVTMHHG